VLSWNCCKTCAIDPQKSQDLLTEKLKENMYHPMFNLISGTSDSMPVKKLDNEASLATSIGFSFKVRAIHERLCL